MVEIVREKILSRQSVLFVKAPTIQQKKIQRDQKGREKSCAAGDLDNRCTERTPHKCSICGSEDHLIAKCPKTPKDNDNWRKKVCFNEKVNRACNNGKNNSDRRIYSYVS